MKGPLFRDNGLTKISPDSANGGTTSLGQSVRDLVGIDNADTEFGEAFGDASLTASDSSGEADYQWHRIIELRWLSSIIHAFYSVGTARIRTTLTTRP